MGWELRRRRMVEKYVQARGVRSQRVLAALMAVPRHLFVEEALRDRVPTVESSQYKLFMNESGQRLANAALDILGAEGTLRPGEEEAPIGGRFERSYRYTVVDTIGGGASEIQKNIIAARGLGLPRQ